MKPKCVNFLLIIPFFINFTPDRLKRNFLFLNLYRKFVYFLNFTFRSKISFFSIKIFIDFLFCEFRFEKLLFFFILLILFLNLFIIAITHHYYIVNTLFTKLIILNVYDYWLWLLNIYYIYIFFLFKKNILFYLIFFNFSFFFQILKNKQKHN